MIMFIHSDHHEVLYNDIYLLFDQVINIFVIYLVGDKNFANFYVDNVPNHYRVTHHKGMLYEYIYIYIYIRRL